MEGEGRKGAGLGVEEHPPLLTSISDTYLIHTISACNTESVTQGLANT